MFSPVIVVLSLNMSILAVRLIYGIHQYDHVTPLLQELHHVNLGELN